MPGSSLFQRWWKISALLSLSFTQTCPVWSTFTETESLFQEPCFLQVAFPASCSCYDTILAHGHASVAFRCSGHLGSLSLWLFVDVTPFDLSFVFISMVTCHLSFTWEVPPVVICLPLSSSHIVRLFLEDPKGDQPSCSLPASSSASGPISKVCPCVSPSIHMRPGLTPRFNTSASSLMLWNVLCLLWP